MKLEFNVNLFELEEKYISSFLAGGRIMITPPVGNNYWLFRVGVSDVQGIVAFPKFGTLGIGFELEEYWNTNLPYTCKTMEIYNHIKHNKGDDKISDSDCIEAIKMIQEACHKFAG